MWHLKTEQKIYFNMKKIEPSCWHVGIFEYIYRLVHVVVSKVATYKDASKHKFNALISNSEIIFISVNEH